MQHKEPSLLHRAWPWDTAIAFLLIASPLGAAYAYRWLPQPYDTIVMAVLLVGWGLTAYGTFFEPGFLFLNKKFIRISALPALRIAFAADFHVGPYRDASHVRRVVEKLKEQNADLILLPGDFVFDEVSDLADLEPLKELRAPLGVFATMGNHDSGDHLTFAGERYRTVDRRAEITALLESYGIHVLRDECVRLEKDGVTFAVAGVDETWSQDMRIDESMEHVPTDVPVILLAHNPDVAMRPECSRAALIACGHVHGGQIRFPFIGPLYVPAETKKRFAGGIFTIGRGTVMAVTRGCGETLPRARLFCPPEIVLLVNGVGGR